MADPFRLDGRIVLVTGASRGIGLGMAVEAARGGAGGVVIAARTAATLADARIEVEAAGARCVDVVADVTQEGEAAHLVERAISEFGRLDTLVNNAGGAPIKAPLTEVRPERWWQMVGLNLFSAYLVSRAVLATWTEPAPGRSIVNIGSTSGLRGYPGLAHYSAAKHGLIGLTRTLARESAAAGIRVNCVCPHLVETPLTATARSGPRYQELVAEIPLGRWGELEEIARVVRFLASDAASYITGAVIAVDGGWSS